MQDTKRYTGTILVTKGTYGFIESEGFTDNVFFHRSEVISEGDLRKGDMVSFELKTNPRFGGEQASKVKLEHGGNYENPES